MNRRGRATHWADVLAARYAPTKEQAIAEVVGWLEAEHGSDQDIVLAQMIREAHGRPPLPPLEERITAERARLEAMTVGEILAERAGEARKITEMLDEATAHSAAEEQRIRTIYGKTPNSQEDLR